MKLFCISPNGKKFDLVLVRKDRSDMIDVDAYVDQYEDRHPDHIWVFLEEYGLNIDHASPVNELTLLAELIKFQENGGQITVTRVDWKEYF